MKKSFLKIMAMILVTLLVLSIFAACGQQGEQGSADSQGEKDENSHTPVITIQDGKWYIDGVDTGVFAEGVKGNTGLSAFKIYQKYHPEYTGTEEEWVESLKGADGAQGVSVVNAYINSEMHLILVLSNNTEIDAGYVGVTTTPVEELTYTYLKETDSYEVNGIGTISDLDIVIPSTYKGKAVTSIGDYAFENCTSLTNVTIPDSVTSIGECAFYNCDSLNTIYCEANNKPYGWSRYWLDGCGARVFWGDEWEYVDGVPTLNNSIDLLPPVEAEIWAMIEEQEAEWMRRHNTYDYKKREFPDGVTRECFYFSIKAEGGQFPVAVNPTDHPNPEIAGTWPIAHTVPVAVYIKDINKDTDYTKYEITHWYTSRWFEMYAAVDGFEPVDGAQYDIFMFCMSGDEETGATYPNTLHYLWDFGEPYTYQAPYVEPETSENLTQEQIAEIKGDKLALLPHGGLSIDAEGKLFYSCKMDNGPFGHEAITDAEGNTIAVYGIEKTSLKELYINGKKYDIVAGSYTTMDWYKLQFYIKDFTPVAGQTYEVLFTLNSEDKTGVYCKNSEGYFVHIAEYTFYG